ncbi:MAG: prevent-host-death protein [Rhodocyclaceae bacterium]|nr:prevent-host-death protein [Rhodocyclaceae bacterium]
MKSANLPSIRVEPQMRAEAEALLAEGETLSMFIEQSVRAAIEQRRHQSEFIARGLAALARAKETGESVDADAVIATLRTRLVAARAKTLKPGP